MLIQKNRRQAKTLVYNSQSQTILSIAQKIADGPTIKRIVQDLEQSNMGIKWELIDCQDGVNMYSDQKLKPGVYDKDMGKEATISRKEAEKILREQNELTKRIISSSGGASLCDMMAQVCTLMFLVSNSQQIKSYAINLEEKTGIKAG